MPTTRFVFTFDFRLLYVQFVNSLQHRLLALFNNIYAIRLTPDRFRLRRSTISFLTLQLL